MKILPFVYLGYMFIGLYMFFLFLLIYLRNRNDIFSYPKADKTYSITVITPAYNEEESIEDTVRQVLSSTYPIKEMIVVNDGSKDKTGEIVKRLMKEYSNLKLLDKKNSGKADSMNQALKIAQGELIAVIDADSYPKPDAIEKMIGFFQDKEVGAVTSAVLVKNKDKFIERMQAFEYTIIAWTRKLLDYIGGVWATPGPLSIYRTSALKKINGFNTKVMTEDIEITWHLLAAGYRTRMCLSSNVYSIPPSKFIRWFRQRIRWDIGGMQTIWIYKSVFLRRGMLGFFIVPFFLLSMFLGLLGISIFSYLIIKNALLTYFFTGYSIAAGTSLLSIKEINLTPSVLNFFGVVLFLIGFSFTYFGLRVMKSENLHHLGGRNIFNILFYLIVYLTCYPLILLVALSRIARGKISWGTK